MIRALFAYAITSFLSLYSFVGLSNSNKNNSSTRRRKYLLLLFVVERMACLLAGCWLATCYLLAS
jgi:hypothetical protein